MSDIFFKLDLHLKEELFLWELPKWFMFKDGPSQAIFTELLWPKISEVVCMMLEERSEIKFSLM